MRRVVPGIGRMCAVKAAILAAVAATLSVRLALADGPIPAADPGAPGEQSRQTLCCGLPPDGEVRADHVFGRWVVTQAGIGAPLRVGERVAFRRDGTLETSRGVCRYAVLRAELTIDCGPGTEIGELSFVDDTKLIWRRDGHETVFIAPAD